MFERDPDFGTDRLTSAILDFPAGQATILISTQAGPATGGSHQHLGLIAEKGWVRMDFPYAHSVPSPCHLFIGGASSIGSKPAREIAFEPVNQYTLQAERFSALVRGEDCAGISDRNIHRQHARARRAAPLRRERRLGKMSDIMVRPLRADDAAQWRVLRLEALTRLSDRVPERLRGSAGAGSVGAHSAAGSVRASCSARSTSGTLSRQRRAARLARHEAAPQGGAWGMYVAPSHAAAWRRRHAGARRDRACAHARRRRAARRAARERTPRRRSIAASVSVSYGIEKRALRYDGVDHDDELMALDLQNGL